MNTQTRIICCFAEIIEKVTGYSHEQYIKERNSDSPLG